MQATLARMIADPEPDRIAEHLSDRVVFLSPVADYEGRDDVAHLLGHIAGVLDEVSIMRELHDGDRTTTFLRAEVDGQELLGVVDEHRDPDGGIDHAVLWLRPLPALRLAVAEMGRRLAADPLSRDRP